VVTTLTYPTAAAAPSQVHTVFPPSSPAECFELGSSMKRRTSLSLARWWRAARASLTRPMSRDSRTSSDWERCVEVCRGLYDHNSRQSASRVAKRAPVRHALGLFLMYGNRCGTISVRLCSTQALLCSAVDYCLPSRMYCRQPEG
jgi:hypothetical protein